MRSVEIGQGACHVTVSIASLMGNKGAPVSPVFAPAIDGINLDPRPHFIQNKALKFSRTGIQPPHQKRIIHVVKKNNERQMFQPLSISKNFVYLSES